MCTLHRQRKFIPVFYKGKITVHVYLFFCWNELFINLLIMFFTPKYGGIYIGNKIFELGPSEAEILQILICGYMPIYGICPYMVINLGLNNFL